MSHRRFVRRRRSSRPAVAIVLVIGLLAVTLGVGYAMLYMQTTSVAVDANYVGIRDARLAAMTGMSVALRTMHQDDWAGVNSSISGQLGEGLSFTATYTAGDASLAPGHPDYAEYPYRVTIQCIGAAARAQGASPPSTHTIETVVMLVPRAMQSWPSTWSRVQGKSVFQWNNENCVMELPTQFAGNVHAQGDLSFASKTPSDDQRPFDGYIDEVAVIKKALTAADILAIHNAAKLGLAPSPETLILSHNPVAYWRFNEGPGATTAVTAAGSFAGEYVSAKSGQSLKPFASAGNSARFDGLNDCVHCGNFDISGDKLTLLLWFRAESLSSKGTRLIAKATGVSDQDQYWALGTTSTLGINRLKFWIRTEGSTKSVESLAGTVVPLVWTFAAAVYDGNTMRIYMDGLQVGALGDLDESLNTSSNAMVVIGDTPPGSPRGRLMRDYTMMQLAAQGDNRPVTGEWATPSGKLSSEAQSLFTDELKATVSTVPVDTTAPVSFPLSVTSYQLYKGGPVYQSTVLPSSIQSGVTLVADPKTNPLGIFRYNGALEISSATIRGTLLVDNSVDKITLLGGNITIDAVNLPVLDGETVNRQLPIVISPGDVAIRKELTSAQLRGMVVSGAKFDVQKSGNTPNVKIEGALVTRRFTIAERDNWSFSKNDWRNYMIDFLKQKKNGIAYFPQWLTATYPMTAMPLTTVTPDGSGRLYHWPDFSKPLFEKRASDEGLRWRIVSWKDGG